MKHRSTVLHILLPLLAAAVIFEGCFPSAPRFRTPPSTSIAGAPQSSASSAPTPNIDDRALDISEGMASYYGDEFNGRKTSSGEVFDNTKLTCAHRKYDFGTRLRVVNLDNGRTCEVTVNDRGPFVANRVVDLSYAAAHDIGMIGTGTTRVRLEVLEWGRK